MAITLNGANWLGGTIKQAQIAVIRGTNQVVLASTAVISQNSYNMQVVGTIELLLNDVIQCGHLAQSLTSGTPQLLALQNEFDYNTTFTWTFIRST
jgi:hypothetical protein